MLCKIGLRSPMRRFLARASCGCPSAEEDVRSKDSLGEHGQHSHNFMSAERFRFCGPDSKICLKRRRPMSDIATRVSVSYCFGSKGLPIQRKDTRLSPSLYLFNTASSSNGERLRRPFRCARLQR